jgi:hypothetical protein
MANYVYPAIALIGGGTGALDAIDGAALADKDMAYVTVGGFTYFYILDADLNQAEASPWRIVPNANAGTKVWVLQPMYPFAVTAAGEVTNTTQPAFLAFNSETDADVTGNGDAFVVIFNSEVFDQNADFDGTSTFTAPVTGRYRFSSKVMLDELAAAHNSQTMQLVTSNRNYFGTYDTFAAGANPFVTTRVFSVDVLADMDAADTATVSLNIAGGTKVVDVFGHATTLYTHFSGELVC